MTARAQVSVSYYERLEQARASRPSPQVLDALATALQLTGAERDHGSPRSADRVRPSPSPPGDHSRRRWHGEHDTSARPGPGTTHRRPARRREQPRRRTLPIRQRTFEVPPDAMRGRHQGSPGPRHATARESPACAGRRG
ncbi:helix-turn-helix domain-containing protein [Amycolatopsis sp. YIM 10]|uniref:helix-turn-helix domain-containing protein n=1 Tax=Amycolatopsis sp. YIM 10 TaxID=2653857 RepID=UPI00351A959E